MPRSQAVELISPSSKSSATNGKHPDDDVHRRGDDPLGARRQLPLGNASRRCARKPMKSPLKTQPEGEEERVLGARQRGEEPRKPDEDQQDAGPVLRTSRPRDEPARDEGQPRRDGERDRRRLAGDVVARDDSSDGARSCEQRERPDPDDAPDAHSRSAASLLPDNSAFGTKPRAGLRSIRPGTRRRLDWT